jgi:hypothetical protein
LKVKVFSSNFHSFEVPKVDTHKNTNAHVHRHPDIYFTIPKNEHLSKGKQAARPDNEKNAPTV